MWHMLANHLQVSAGSGPGVFQQAPAVPDDEFSRSGAGDYQVPRDLMLAAIAAVGLPIVDARINTATLRLRGFPRIYPFEALAVWPTDPNIMDLRGRELTLRTQEDYRLEYDDGGAVTAASFFSIITDSPYPVSPPPREARWVRFTATLTGIVGAWSGVGQMALGDVLESDSYAVWGMRVQDAVNGTALAARMSFQGQKWRPGCLVEPAVGLRSDAMFRGGLGVYGNFRLYSLPQIEIFDTAAAGATLYTIDLLLSRIG